MKIPKQVELVLKTLNQNSYEAYLVGGCVRDYLMNNTPFDFDLTTNALPIYVKKIFADYHIIETGIKHGTVTVIIDQFHIEITTYRIDGEYSDNRHPNSVTYTNNLIDDLARRDFTMNSIAFNPKTGLIDPFRGIKDIEYGIIRSVNDPSIRFKEDALRMMRALRFSAQLGFEIENDTLLALRKNTQLIVNISVERISSELKKIFVAKNLNLVISDLYLIMTPIVHEFKSLILDFESFERACQTVVNCEEDYTLRLAAFLRSAHCDYDVQDILNRLRIDRNAKMIVIMVLKYQDYVFTSEKSNLKVLLDLVGYDVVSRIFKLKQALNKSENCKEIIAIDHLVNLLEQIIERNECYTIGQLAINGTDLLALGFESKKIGSILNAVLNQVIEENIVNNKQDIIKWIKLNF